MPIESDRQMMIEPFPRDFLKEELNYVAARVRIVKHANSGTRRPCASPLCQCEHWTRPLLARSYPKVRISYSSNSIELASIYLIWIISQTIIGKIDRFHRQFFRDFFTHSEVVGPYELRMRFLIRTRCFILNVIQGDVHHRNDRWSTVRDSVRAEAE